MDTLDCFELIFKVVALISVPYNVFLELFILLFVFIERLGLLTMNTCAYSQN